MNKPKLFFFHFAGGNAYSFNFLCPYLETFELFPLELPGRGKRIDELLIKDFYLASLDLYNQVLKNVSNNNFVIYGHSLGAYLALSVAIMLENDNLKPFYLLVSGNPGPGIKDKLVRYNLEKELFIDELKKLKGIPEEIYENDEYFSFFEPILRADFEIVENQLLFVKDKINVPIYAMMGNEEENVDKINNWANFTKSKFNYKIFKGGHFFIHEYPKEIATIIKSCYEKNPLF